MVLSKHHTKAPPTQAIPTEPPNDALMATEIINFDDH